MMIEESKLRELIAKWRSHWAVVGDHHTDIAATAIGVTVGICANELEALLAQSSADTKPRSPITCLASSSTGHLAMNLKLMAEKYELGWLLEKSNEKCQASQLEEFAFEIARRAAVEGWKSAAKSLADSYNDQLPDEPPSHLPETLAINLLISGW